MKRTGYVVKIKAKGKDYFYLRRSYRDKSGEVNKETIYSFGERSKAINKINSWNTSDIPGELKACGFTKNDLLFLINTIKNK